MRNLAKIIGAAAALLALTATPAAAQQTHVLRETLGSAAHPSFKTASALAVDQSTGDVLVVDFGGVQGTANLSRFKPDGEPDPFPALGTNVIDAAKGPGGKPCAEEPASCDETPEKGFFPPGGLNNFKQVNMVQIAIDESGGVTDGNIYVTQAQARVVDAFSAEGNYLGQLSKTGPTKKLSEPCGVAVDPAGNVYVGDGDKVHKFTPSANPPLNTDFVTSFTTVTRPCTLAVGAGPTAGSLFVTRYFGAVYKLDLASGALKYVVEEGSVPAPFADTVTVSVDPGTGHVLVIARDAVNEYDASGAAAPVLLSATEGGGRGVAADGSSGDIYVSRGDSSQNNSRVDILDAPIVTLAEAVTKPASDRTPTRATLNGTIDPDGAPLTECFFEYGHTTAYGLTVPCAESPAEIGTGTEPVAVHADLSGLSGSYSYRLVAVNANGRDDAAGLGTGAGNEFFNTAPALETKAASQVTGASARLNGSVNPDGGPVGDCLFEYGETIDYGQTVPCAESPAEIGTGIVAVPVHADLSGLDSGILYYFRLSATVTAGAAKGSDQNFTTPQTVITEAATDPGVTSATLHGKVNPLGEAFADCLFEYGKTTGYGQTVPCAESPAEIGTGTDPVPVHADLSNLGAGTTYHFRLAATNSAGAVQGQDRSFQTVGALIPATWAAGVTRSEAELSARIDPRGHATRFHVEYGTTAFYGRSTVESGLAANIGEQTGAAFLEGLQPSTTYHYRFVATSHCDEAQPLQVCTTEGPDTTFTTYAPARALKTDCQNQAFRIGSAAQLPDCRSYEMVSPVDKRNGDVAPLKNVTGYPADIELSAPDGERVTYSSSRAFADAQAAPYTSQYIAERDSGSGWSTHSINAPQSGFSVLEGATLDTSYKAFSEDLCSGWVLRGTQPPLTPDGVVGYPNLYRHDNCAGGGFEALTTVAPSGLSKPNEFFPVIQGFSTDHSHTFFRVRGGLTEGASTLPQVYERYGNGKLRLVCVLPDGTPSTQRCSLGTKLTTEGVENRFDSVDHAVSADGSRVFWTDGDGVGRLYVRIDETPQVDGDEETAPISGGGPSFFRGAAVDGSVAIWSNGGQLHEFDTDSREDRLIAGGVQGVLGMSEDASRVYLASTEVLSGEEENSEGDEALAGKSNLYLYEAGGGFSFIGRLSTAEDENGRYSPIAREPFWRASKVTPDGMHAAFMSTAPLTGYDNTDRVSGEDDAEVFLYDATDKKLACVSCNPTNARPVGRQISFTNLHELWAASQLPTWEYQLHDPRSLADDGSSLFFESYDSLVLGDTNGKQDVYEWEQGNSQEECEADKGAELYVARAGSCISLLSSGESPTDSEFVDADSHGRDVFVKTAASLLPYDPGLVDLYDVRSGGGFPLPPASPAACEGEACQGASSPPDDPTPASSSFEGIGNQRAGAPRCAKGKVRRSGRCQARKKQKHHKRAARRHRTDHERRAGK